MRKFTKFNLGLILFTCLVFTACVKNDVLPLGDVSADIDRDILYQCSTLEALLDGNYDGFCTVAQLKEKGDFGIGTFEGLDGELVMLDGVVYKVKDTGEVLVVEDDEKVPFAAITFFDKDITVSLNDIKDYETLKKELDAMLDKRHIFYAFRIDGDFEYIKLRSVPKQEKPYPVLTEVTKNQSIFEYQDIKGTLVGFWCPDNVGGINLPEYHLHFISEDKSKGGHLIDLKINKSEAYADYTKAFMMILPDEVVNSDLEQSYN